MLLRSFFSFDFMLFYKVLKNQLEKFGLLYTCLKLALIIDTCDGIKMGGGGLFSGLLTV